MKYIKIAALAAFVLMMFSCTTFTPSDQNTTPPANQVNIQGFAFLPLTLTVLTGTTVTWKNFDSAAHTATGTTAVQMFDSGSIAQGNTYSFKFTLAGTNNYNCTFHPAMTGMIIVTN